MKKITYSEFCQKMWEHGRTHNNNEDWDDQIFGVIVYKAENWDKPYTEEQRSYRVGSFNRCFQAGKIAKSMFAECLDGTDKGIRLDWYKWEPEYCYFE